MDKPVCGKLDCIYFDPDVCFEGCMLEDEPTDEYAHNEDDTPEYSYVYQR